MLFSRMHNIFLGRPISLKRNLTQRKMWRTWRTTKKWQFCDGHLVQDGWRWHVHFVVMVEGVHISSFRSKKTFLSACCNFLTASSALFSESAMICSTLLSSFSLRTHCSSRRAENLSAISSTNLAHS
ncbi:hypothetical protein E1B28_010930 [Marasmius oreades]|uniref:Uncharacterized protein n=1 Tax=Marasmius oreades TaxID=181124 RepID=A0A9P7RTS0_9AGAR|nr:uncharacterized protein E1B28_010930 [Marasmius oreades]KAG7089230.1 hypothetical protein E1B28_010930 [Marasmius oreades]